MSLSNLPPGCSSTDPPAYDEDMADRLYSITRAHVSDESQADELHAAIFYQVVLECARYENAGYQMGYADRRSEEHDD